MLLAYYLRYSQAVVRTICKIFRRTTAPEFFITKLQADWKRESDTVLFKNTSGRLLWKLSVFSCFLWQFFTRNPETTGTFRERFIFQIIEFFLLFMSGFYTLKPRHVDESSRTKQRLYWQSIHASVNVTKTKNFLHSFSKVFVVLKF